MLMSMAPNHSLCADMELASVGFMSVDESAAFAKNLAGLGLKFLWEGRAIDITIADQVVGLRTPCEWVELKRVQLTPTGSRVLVACLKGSGIRQVAVPEGWTYGKSLSQDFFFKSAKMFRVQGGPE